MVPGCGGCTGQEAGPPGTGITTAREVGCRGCIALRGQQVPSGRAGDEGGVPWACSVPDAGERALAFLTVHRGPVPGVTGKVGMEGEWSPRGRECSVVPTTGAPEGPLCAGPRDGEGAGLCPHKAPCQSPGPVQGDGAQGDGGLCAAVSLGCVSPFGGEAGAGRFLLHPSAEPGPAHTMGSQGKPMTSEHGRA